MRSALVVLCGLPAAGKTRFAEALRERLAAEQPERRIAVINEEALGIDRAAAYASGHTEKNLRDAIKAAAERALAPNTCTIVDSVNFIKGFRYELYCRGRALQAAHCVVYCLADPDVVRSNNTAREDPAAQYPDKVMTDLIGRFETPNPRNRWDAPLVEVAVQDHASVAAALDAVVAALDSAKPQKISLATKHTGLSASDLLHGIDRAVQDVIAAVRQGQEDAVPGDRLAMPGTEKLYVVRRRVPLPELRRYRTQFSNLVTQHPPQSAGQAAALFVDFLNTQTGRE